MASRKSNCLTCATSGELLVGHALDAVTQGSVARHWHADWVYAINPTRVTHAHLLGDDDAFCATCYTSLTVNHILIECPQFNHLRQQYHFGSTLKELFNNSSVNDIIAFIKDTHFYTRI